MFILIFITKVPSFTWSNACVSVIDEDHMRGVKFSVLVPRLTFAPNWLHPSDSVVHELLIKKPFFFLINSFVANNIFLLCLNYFSCDSSALVLVLILRFSIIKIDANVIIIYYNNKI
jgi:hypothetical protein